jgi:hypothetical protein
MPVLGEGDEALLARYVAGHASLDDRVRVTDVRKEHPAVRLCLETVRYVLDTEPIAGAPHIRSPMEAIDRDYMLGRYTDAIKLYLRLKLCDTKLADEVYRELCVKLLDHTLVEPEGPIRRFREYLLTVLRRLIIDYFRDKGIRRSPPADVLDDSKPDRDFEVVWREAVLTQAMTRLERYQLHRPENPFYTVVQLRSNHPKDTMKDLAAKVSEQLGRPVTSGECRKMLQQARSKYFDLLMNELRDTLFHPEPKDLEAELDNLGLRRRNPPDRSDDDP